MNIESIDAERLRLMLSRLDPKKFSLKELVEGIVNFSLYLASSAAIKPGEFDGEMEAWNSAIKYKLNRFYAEIARRDSHDDGYET